MHHGLNLLAFSPRRSRIYKLNSEGISVFLFEKKKKRRKQTSQNKTMQWGPWHILLGPLASRKQYKLIMPLLEIAF